MGNAETKERFGEKVNAARYKLTESQKKQTEHLHSINDVSPAMSDIILKSIEQSFLMHSPFPEETLMMAWFADPTQCETILINACNGILKQPVNKQNFLWFRDYVLSSSVWFLESKDNQFMFSYLLKIADKYSKEMIDSMNMIYNSLQNQPGWKELMMIKSTTLIERQDHEKVGLLKEKSFVDFNECSNAEQKESHVELENLVDSKIAINILLCTAKEIDKEFQNHIDLLLSEYGEFARGPLKKLDRCQSKVEQDYFDANFPRSAKLLDIVRCSVTFNTLSQLVAGYQRLLEYIGSNPSFMELSRVKNGFLDSEYVEGYRDLKLNIIYHSQTNIEKKVSMICEVQLLLNQYLWEKKRIHRLYSILRMKDYFESVVKKEANESNEEQQRRTVLQLKKAFELREHGGLERTDCAVKSSVDSALGLLAFEDIYTTFKLWCYDMKTKKVVFEHAISAKGSGHSHHWIKIKNDKYLVLQPSIYCLKFFKIEQGDKDQFIFTEDASIQITVDKDIDYVEFDRTFSHIFMLLDAQTLQKRSMSDVNTIMSTMDLEESIEPVVYKQLVMSNDGTLCAIGGGTQSYLYIINITENNQENSKYESTLNSTFSPCFINGENEMVAVGDNGGNVEILSVPTKQSLRVIKVFNNLVSCMHSVGNILAVSGWDHKLKLFNIENWEVILEEEFEMDQTYSLHLSSDAKYLSLGGSYPTDDEDSDVEGVDRDNPKFEETEVVTVWQID
eukprot:279287_1